MRSPSQRKLKARTKTHVHGRRIKAGRLEILVMLRPQPKPACLASVEGLLPQCRPNTRNSHRKASKLKAITTGFLCMSTRLLASTSASASVSPETLETSLPDDLFRSCFELTPTSHFFLHLYNLYGVPRCPGPQGAPLMIRCRSSL